MAAIAIVQETLTEEAEGQPARRNIVPWLLAAAAVLIALLALPALRSRWSGPRFDELVDLAPRSIRVVEPRLTGGFDWAPYRGADRAVTDQQEAESRRLQLVGVAGRAMERAEKKPEAEVQQVAGVALVLAEMPDAAVTQLRAATKRDPENASAWSDLAAAIYAAALRFDRPRDYTEALACADRARSIDPKHAEAHFNRALILERLGLTQHARTAWQQYLELDSTSQWAVEARARLAALPATRGDNSFRRELPRLEESAARGDAAAVAELVRRWPEQSRAWGEAEFLGRWGEAPGHSPEAARLLTVARAIGAALAATRGETLLRDAVQAIDSGDETRRNALALAHATYRRGRMAYSRQLPVEAERDLRAAAASFARSGSPMALMARYYAANTRYDANDFTRARTELTELLTEADARHNFVALGALVRWELALCHSNDGDAAGALPLLRASEAALARLGETNSLGFVTNLLAEAHEASGAPDEAWRARIRSFAMLSTDARADRLPASLGSAAGAELHAGRTAEALALLDLQRDASRSVDNDVLLSNTLMRASLVHAQQGDSSAAAKYAAEAVTAAQRIADAPLRERALAHAALARGASLAATDPRGAADALDGAIVSLTKLDTGFLPRAHLLQARAQARLGDSAAAAAELDRGIEAFERRRTHLTADVVVRGIGDPGAELFAEAIRASLDRNDPAAAFAYMERARAQVGADARRITASALSARLAGTHVAVLALAALPDSIGAVLVTGNGVTASRKALPRAAAVIERASANDAAALQALSAAAIAPFDWSGIRAVVVVAGDALESVPFAALEERRGRPLVETMSVSIAESATSLVSAPRSAAPQTLVALALPAGGDAAALPESAAEIGEIARSYRHAVRLESSSFAEAIRAARDADVLHLSGHTARTEGSGDAALVFTAGERVAWRTIASARAVPGVVVLSACETLRRADATGTRALSLGGGFLAAGAHDVIGTLTPIADRDARALFAAIHAQLATGTDPAEAVRNAQLAAIARGDAERIRWSAVALLTRRIPQPAN